MTLRNWLKEEKTSRGERPGGLSGDEREELNRFNDENATLGWSGRSCESSGLLRETGRPAPDEAFSLIAAEKTNYPVAVMCRVLDLSQTGFHNWERRAPSDRALIDAWLIEKIKQLHDQSRGVYEAPRIHAELWMEHNIKIGRKRTRSPARSSDGRWQPTCAPPSSSTRSRWRSHAGARRRG